MNIDAQSLKRNDLELAKKATNGLGENVASFVKANWGHDCLLVQMLHLKKLVEICI